MRLTSLFVLFTQGDDVDWPGLLSTEASLILHQHSIQGDITPLQEALCYWLAFSQKYREKRYDATCLWNILKTLEEKWNDGRLAGEEVSREYLLLSMLITYSSCLSRTLPWAISLASLSALGVIGTQAKAP